MTQRGTLGRRALLVDFEPSAVSNRRHSDRVMVRGSSNATAPVTSVAAHRQSPRLAVPGINKRR